MENKWEGSLEGQQGSSFLRAALENVHTLGPAETSPGSSDITLCSPSPAPPQVPLPALPNDFQLADTQSLQGRAAGGDDGRRSAAHLAGCEKGKSAGRRGWEPGVPVPFRATEGLWNHGNSDDKFSPFGAT